MNRQDLERITKVVEGEVIIHKKSISRSLAAYPELFMEKVYDTNGKPIPLCTRFINNAQDSAEVLADDIVDSIRRLIERDEKQRLEDRAELRQEGIYSICPFCFSGMVQDKKTKAFFGHCSGCGQVLITYPCD